MKANFPNALARALRDFFTDHLPRLRGMSVSARVDLGRSAWFVPDSAADSTN